MKLGGGTSKEKVNKFVATLEEMTKLHGTVTGKPYAS